jgi:hypothetical protein
LGDVEFDFKGQEHNFDLVALEDAMKELYVRAKCTKLVTIIFFMKLCTIHEINNKIVDEFFALL